MKKLFQKFGFWEERRGDLPFAFRARPPQVDLSLGTSGWLVNFGWGDNDFVRRFATMAVEPSEGQVSRASSKRAS
jgi:hypothetical protein